MIFMVQASPRTNQHEEQDDNGGERKIARARVNKSGRLTSELLCSGLNRRSDSSKAKGSRP